MRSLSRTGKSIRNKNQQELLCIHPLQLLQQPQVQQSVRLPVRLQQHLDLRPRLPVNLLQEGKLVRRYQVRSLVSLHTPSSVKVKCHPVSCACSTSHGTGLARILFELSSRKVFETSEIGIVANCAELAVRDDVDGREALRTEVTAGGYALALVLEVPT